MAQEVWLEGGGHLFDLHVEMPVLDQDDILVYVDEDGSEATYKVESRVFRCEKVSAPTEGGAETVWRPPGIRYTVSVVP